MTTVSLEVKLEEVALADGRYPPDAYRFVFDSLDFIILKLGRNHRPIGDRHISVEQLLEGIKDYALDHFGPLSRIVLENWGIYNTADFGEIVFSLVEAGLLNRQDSDMKEDFQDGFNFRDAFEEGYVPEIPWQSGE